MAAGADHRAVGVDRAERLARVLDQPQAAGLDQPLERRHVGGVAEHVHGQHGGGALAHRGGGGGGIEVQRHGVDVGEHRLRSLVQHGVGRGHEREGAGHHLVAVRHAGSAQRQVQSGGAAGHRARVGGADASGERLLELLGAGP